LCSTNQPSKNGKNHNKLQKIRYISGKQNNVNAKFYNPSELVAVDEVIVFFKKACLSQQQFL